MYPNPLPTDRNLIVLNETSKNIDRIEFFNLSGDIIFSKNINDNHKKIILKLNNLSVGIHLLLIHFEDGFFEQESTRLTNNAFDEI